MRLMWTLAALAWIGGGLLVQGAAPVMAQPPTRVFGAVMVNGQPPPLGTRVEAFIDGNRCGSGEVRDVGPPVGIGFVVDVDSAGFNPGCGDDGDPVTFRVGGLEAIETATFQTGTFVRLDLTAQGTPSSPPPATPAPASPSPQATPSPGGATSPTPTAPAGTPAPTMSPTPGASPTATPAASPTATATATPVESASPTATSTTVSTAEEGDDGGVPPVVWVVVIVAVVGAAAGAYIYQRRGAAG